MYLYINDTIVVVPICYLFTKIERCVFLYCSQFECLIICHHGSGTEFKVFNAMFSTYNRTIIRYNTKFLNKIVHVKLNVTFFLRVVMNIQQSFPFRARVYFVFFLHFRIKICLIEFLMFAFKT